ncbi:MAG TPA: 30S ribosome-binding factor RbfA [Phycisphaerales bacterium]|nr:30S ribosome-binding factor RbfA [Phycisphaerales bacterium]
MSRRTDKVAAALQRALQDLLVRGLQDPRIKGLVTVTKVRVTEDLTTAFVSVSVLPAEDEPLTLHGLRAAAAFIRRELGEVVPMRKLPALDFQLDRSIKREAEVLAALERVRREREERGEVERTPETEEQGS